VTHPKIGQESATARLYRIDFALIVLTGNITRYLQTRPIVERDPTVVARWYPIRTWFAEDPLRFLPGALRIRARHLLDSLPLYLRRPGAAVVIHAFETYYLYVLLHRLLRRKTIIVKNPDGGFPGSNNRWSRALRALAIERTSLFVPWSHAAAVRMREQYPGLPEDKVMVLHPGIDLTRWPLRTPVRPGSRFRLLFVGGDLMRKGADTLLDAYEQFLADTCELDIATQSGYLPAHMKSRIDTLRHVHLHVDLESGSLELRQLFRQSDAFVLPTNQDASPWVVIEAMASGVPVIVCPQGGIPDIVRDGETGLLIPPKDPVRLAEAVDRLRMSPELQERLIAQGRAHVEADFDAEKNTTHLLNTIKRMIDENIIALSDKAS